MKEKKRIALFTDNTKLAETLRLNLEDEGYDVIRVAGAEKDLKEMNERQINLLIFDVDVPVWRIEFLKEAKRINPLLAVILLSPFEENLTRFMLKEIEIAKTFIKPFELEEFSNSIRSILNYRM